MPDTPAPACPCFVCGTDYLTSEQTLALTMPAAIDLPEGCECPGCVQNRALLANADRSAGVAPEDGIDYLAAVAVEWRPPVTLWSTSVMQTTTVLLCPEHLAALRTTLASATQNTSCYWCGTRDASLVTDALGFDFSNRIPGALRIARRGTAGRTTVRYQTSYSLAELSDERIGEWALCQPCVDGATTCDGCASLVRDGDLRYCEDCEMDVCPECWDSRHYRHTDASDGYDRARYNFAPRQTIEGALNAPGSAGTTIVSTRALGIEVETARGNAQVVIDAERQAAIPVLQAVGTDGSVRGRNPVEYRLLPQRGVFAEYALRSMAMWCREAEYAPDSSAGIHMHVDCRSHTPEQVWRAFAALVILEPVLFSHAAPERLRSQYCQGYGENGGATVVAALAEAARSPRYFEPDAVSVGSRYRSVNCHAFSSHSTLEVRVFDSAHDEDSVERFTDAAAIIAGAVDFAVSSAWHDFAATITGASFDRTAAVLSLLGRMVAEGHITSDTFARACARLDARTLVAA